MFCNICCFVQKLWQRWNNWRVADKVFGVYRRAACIQAAWVESFGFLWAALCVTLVEELLLLSALCTYSVSYLKREKTLKKVLRICDLIRYPFMCYWLLIDYEYKKLFSNEFFICAWCHNQVLCILCFQNRKVENERMPKSLTFEVQFLLTIRKVSSYW